MPVDLVIFESASATVSTSHARQRFINSLETPTSIPIVLDLPPRSAAGMLLRAANWKRLTDIMLTMMLHGAGQIHFWQCGE